jgi:hypothetical protein
MPFSQPQGVILFAAEFEQVPSSYRLPVVKLLAKIFEAEQYYSPFAEALGLETLHVI